MARVYLVLAVLAVFFWVFSIVDCAILPEGRHRGVSKVSWILIVVLIPVLGGILWFTVGRMGPNAVPVTLRADDDPSFGPTAAEREERDRRIRDLEAQLAALDEEETRRRNEEGDDKDSGPRS